MDNKATGIETRVEIIEISDKLLLQFVYVPIGFEISKHSLSGYTTKRVGKLNSFNRIKVFEKWKKDNKDLVKSFTEILKKKGWDFTLFPNPTVIAAYLP